MAVYYVYFWGSIPTRLLPSQDVNEVWYLTDQHLTKDRWLICFFFYFYQDNAWSWTSKLPTRHIQTPMWATVPEVTERSMGVYPWWLAVSTHTDFPHMKARRDLEVGAHFLCVLPKKDHDCRANCIVYCCLEMCDTTFFQICLDHLKSFFFWYDFHAN